MKIEKLARIGGLVAALMATPVADANPTASSNTGEMTAKAVFAQCELDATAQALDTQVVYFNERLATIMDISGEDKRRAELEQATAILEAARVGFETLPAVKEELDTLYSSTKLGGKKKDDRQGLRGIERLKVEIALVAGWTDVLVVSQSGVVNKVEVTDALVAAPKIAAMFETTRAAGVDCTEWVEPYVQQNFRYPAAHIDKATIGEVGRSASAIPWPKVNVEALFQPLDKKESKDPERLYKEIKRLRVAYETVKAEADKSDQRFQAYVDSLAE